MALVSLCSCLHLSAIESCLVARYRPNIVVFQEAQACLLCGSTWNTDADAVPFVKSPLVTHEDVQVA